MLLIQRERPAKQGPHRVDAAVSQHRNRVVGGNDEDIVPRRVEQGVETDTTIERVVAIAAQQRVVANTSEEQIIACAYEDRSLIHQVVAPAGSTLLFGEALVHATGQIRSDRERVIIIGGYTPPMFRAWPGQEPSVAYIDSLPEIYRPLIAASESWNWTQRYRTLDMQVGNVYD